MTYGTARFGVFAQGKEMLLKRRGREGKGTGVLNIGELVACGTFAGAVAGMCGVPFGELSPFLPGGELEGKKLIGTRLGRS